jgi:hypothetical protein
LTSSSSNVCGAEPASGVDALVLQGVDNLAVGQVKDVGTQPAQHLAAQAWHLDVQALEVIQAVDFAVVPAAHLHTAIAGGHGLYPVWRIDLVPECLTTAQA